MKIFNKIVWDNKEPSNKSDIWYNGNSFKFYNAGNWQNMWNVNSSDNIIPDITIPTPDWLAKKDEEGHIKNRTHVVLEYCDTLEISPETLGEWGNNTYVSFNLPLNDNDCHIVYLNEGGGFFDIRLQEGSRIPLAGGGISDFDNYLLITDAINSGDEMSYSGKMVINDPAGLEQKYTITLYTRKYISEKVIPDTIARKSDIPTALPNPYGLNWSINGQSTQYKGDKSEYFPPMYVPTTKGNTGEVLVQTETGIPEWKPLESETPDFSVEDAENNYSPTLNLYQTKRIILGSVQEYFISMPSFSVVSKPTNSYVGSIIIYNGQSSESINIIIETTNGDKNFTLKGSNCVKIDYLTNSEGTVLAYIEGNIDVTQ